MDRNAVCRERLFRLLLCGAAVCAALRCGICVRAGICAAAGLLILLLPDLTAHCLRLRLPPLTAAAAGVFLFGAGVLGEAACFYVKYPFWDTSLHALSGFLLAAFGFALPQRMCSGRAHHVPPLFAALAAFCFAVAAGVCWEFAEFASDRLLMTDMQKDTRITAFRSVMSGGSGENCPPAVSGIQQTVIRLSDGRQYVLRGYLDIGLTDTMSDLLADAVGAAVFSAAGYRFLRKRSSFAGAWIPAVLPQAHQTQRSTAKDYQHYETENKG